MKITSFDIHIDKQTPYALSFELDGFFAKIQKALLEVVRREPRGTYTVTITKKDLT